MANMSTSSRFSWSRFKSVALAALFAATGCSDGFRYKSYAVGTATDDFFSVDEAIVQVSGPVYPGVSMAGFKTCYAVSTDPTALSTCLNQAPGAAGITYTAAAITTCQTAGNVFDVHLAHCLSRQSQVIQDHREARQFDIEQCTTAAGPTVVADCLGRSGLRGRIQQVFIDNCVTSDGAIGVERCLRRNGYVSRRPALMQSDVTMCEKVTGAPAALALCLQNADLMPATVTQANIDGCIAVAAGSTARISQCLRVNKFIPRVVMQSHINDCNAAAGQTGIALCLENNGLNVVAAGQAPALQTEIDACVTAGGLPGVAKCLRGKGLLSPKVMQPHISACYAAVGANAFNCLNANFTLPATFTELALKTCFTAATPATAATCLAARRVLPIAPSQEHISACARFADQAGIAGCLSASGLLAAPLVQANIDTCIAAVGLANTSTCLHNQGVVPSFSRMAAATGVLGVNCSGCHNATLASANLNVSLYTSVLAKVLPGNSAGSPLTMRMNSAVAPMPPTGLLPQAQRDPLARWIDQGANEN